MIDVLLAQGGGSGESVKHSVDDNTTISEFLRTFVGDVDEKYRVVLKRGGTVYGQGQDQPHPLLDEMVLVDCDKVTTIPINIQGAN